MMMKSNMGILLFSDANIYDSYFDNNNAPRGGALYSVKLAENCTFISNHGQYGGAIFVLIYLFFLIVMGLPVMTMEFALGRAARKSVVKHRGAPPKKIK